MNAPFDPTPPGAKPDRVPRPKDAATLILVRRDSDAPRILMGQRSKGHVFMPDKWVFPGGRVDRTDAAAPAAKELTPETEAQLSQNSRRKGRAFALAAVRETFEETGLVVGKAGALHGPAPVGWKDFAALHAAPDLSKFTFICRAVTPPMRSRRFDARFFMAFADEVLLDDRSHSSGEELLHVEWFTLDQIEHLDLPAVTRFVMGQVKSRLAGKPTEVPYLKWERGKSVRELMG